MLPVGGRGVRPARASGGGEAQVGFASLLSLSTPHRPSRHLSTSGSTYRLGPVAALALAHWVYLLTGARGRNDPFLTLWDAVGWGAI